MSTIASLAGSSATPSAAATSSDSSAASGLGEINTFLKILTTQLQNQNPLDPMDTATFTTQLAQFSALEQQIDQNANLKTLISTVQDQTNNSAPSYIGDTVQYTGNQTSVQNGAATWDYSLDSNAANVTLTITDELGNVVATQAGDTASGAHAFTYAAGSSKNGKTLKLSVSATNSKGGAVASTLYGIGNVSAVDTTGATAALMVGGVAVPLSTVTQVAKPAASASTSSAPAAATVSTPAAAPAAAS